MIRLLPLALAVALFTGCADECKHADFAAHCEGNTAVTCPEPGVDQLVPVKISNVDCGASTCVTVGNDAFCALSSTPSAGCADAGAVCSDATTKDFCNQGFAVTRFPCLRCDTTDAGAVDCSGGPGDACTGASGCAAGLHCSGRGLCAFPDAGN
jgi:hypothetical protein